jgi:hypothetical protein
MFGALDQFPSFSEGLGKLHDLHLCVVEPEVG